MTPRQTKIHKEFQVDKGVGVQVTGKGATEVDECMEWDDEEELDSEEEIETPR